MRNGLRRVAAVALAALALAAGPAAGGARLRMSTLLGMAQSFERIADRADYLAATWREIDSGGLFDTERFYRDIDYRRFRTLVARDWPARFVVVDDAPRLGWTSAILLMTVAAVLVAGVIALFVWRRLRRRRAMV